MKAPTHYAPSWSARFPHLTVAESTRLGGMSLAPVASLNLVVSSLDTEDNVFHNRTVFCRNLGWSPQEMATLYQVHGNDVITVDEPGTNPGYDALVTQRRDILLAVTIADCTPILLYDAKRQVIGAAHAGWRGTVGRIVDNTLSVMQSQYTSRAEDCWAFIGTCIGKDDFEVDAEVADHFDTTCKSWDTERRKYFVDLKKANYDQLIKAGVPAGQIAVSPFSTITHNDRYFSHRAEKGRTGRMLAVIGRR